MGADFLLWSVPQCRLTDQRKADLRALVEGVSPDGWETSDDYSLEAWRGEMCEAIDFLADITITRHRDVTSCRFKGMPYHMLFTGGMSHGDFPSDAAEWFELINGCTPVFEMLEAWAEQDAKKGD